MGCGTVFFFFFVEEGKIPYHGLHRTDNYEKKIFSAGKNRELKENIRENIKKIRKILSIRLHSSGDRGLCTQGNGRWNPASLYRHGNHSLPLSPQQPIFHPFIGTGATLPPSAGP